MKGERKTLREGESNAQEWNVDDRFARVLRPSESREHLLKVSFKEGIVYWRRDGRQTSSLHHDASIHVRGRRRLYHLTLHTLLVRLMDH